MFAFFEAATFIEYTQSIYVSSAVVLIFFVLMITVLNVNKLFKLIGDCEHLVELGYSISRPIFNETVQFERKLSAIVFFVMAEATPICAFVPWAIFIYFTSAAGDAAFELLFLIWYALLPNPF